jgi:DNA-binding MarR family transcriptional regulator
MAGMDIRVQVVLNIFRASNLLGRVGGKMAAQGGLASAQQWLLLGEIERREGISLKELRQSTLVTKQNITGMVERLRQGGYITTYNDPNDRRVTRVRLTEEGRIVLQMLRPISQASNGETFGTLKPEELNQLASLLERVIERLEQVTQL